MEQFFLFCFQYDSDSGKYAPSAFKLMKMGAVSIVLVVGGVLAVFWRRESKRAQTVETGETVETVETEETVKTQ